MYKPCQNCGFKYSRKTEYGNLCGSCFSRKLLNSEKHTKFQRIQRRKMRFQIEERIIDGQLVKVKIWPPAMAEGCYAGLKTQPYLEHAKRVNSAKGKYRR